MCLRTSVSILPTVYKNNWIHLDHLADFFPTTMKSTLVLLFTGSFAFPKYTFKIPLFNSNTLLSTPFNSVTYDYSIISKLSCNKLGNHISKVTTCSISGCKSSGCVTTDKIYCVLFDSGSFKAWIHTRVLPHTIIQLYNLIVIFSLFETTTSTNLLALQKIYFPEFNCNIVVVNTCTCFWLKESLIQHHLWNQLPW